MTAGQAKEIVRRHFTNDLGWDRRRVERSMARLTGAMLRRRAEELTRAGNRDVAAAVRAVSGAVGKRLRTPRWSGEQTAAPQRGCPAETDIDF